MNYAVFYDYEFKKFFLTYQECLEYIKKEIFTKIDVTEDLFKIYVNIVF